MYEREIIPFKEPRSLAGLAVKPPAVFLPNEKTAELFFRLLHRQSSEQEHAAGLLQGRVPVFGLVRGQGTARPGGRETAARRRVCRMAGAGGAGGAGAFQAHGKAASRGAADAV